LYREILRNFEKYREIFVTKLKFSQGKIHFWIFLHFNTTKKINCMSKVHKYCFKASQISCPPTLFVSCLVSHMPVKCIWCAYLIIYGRSNLNCRFFLLVFMIYLTLHRGKRLILCDFKKCWLKLILFVLDLKNLHNETISRNNLYEISRNFV
jgi:hypothetical protein